MHISGSHHFIDDTAVIGQKQQSLRILVQPSDRIDALWIVYIIHDIILLPLFRRADNTGRLVKSQKNHLILLFYRFSTENHFLRRQYPCACTRRLSVDHDIPRLDLPVRLSARTDARLTQKFVNAYSVFVHMPPACSGFHC